MHRNTGNGGNIFAHAGHKKRGGNGPPLRDPPVLHRLKLLQYRYIHRIRSGFKKPDLEHMVLYSESGFERAFNARVG